MSSQPEPSASTLASNSLGSSFLTESAEHPAKPGWEDGAGAAAPDLPAQGEVGCSRHVYFLGGIPLWGPYMSSIGPSEMDFVALLQMLPNYMCVKDIKHSKGWGAALSCSV